MAARIAPLEILGDDLIFRDGAMLAAGLPQRPHEPCHVPERARA